MPSNSSRPYLRLLLAGIFLISLLLCLTPLGRNLLSRSSPTPTTPPPAKAPDRQAPTAETKSLFGEGFKDRQWQVPADIGNLIVLRRGTNSGPPALDDQPFAANSIHYIVTPYEALRAQVVPFPPGSWVRFDPYAGTLDVRNSPGNLAMIDIVLSNLHPLKVWTIDRDLFHTGEPPRKDHSADILWFEHKLDNIVIPKVHFDNLTLQEAIDFLTGQSRQHDTEDPNSTVLGLPIRILEPATAPENPGGLPLKTSLAQATIPELHLKDVPLATVLDDICESIGIHYSIDFDGVTLLSIDESSIPSLETRKWLVAPAVIDRLRIPPGEPWNVDPNDPFAAFESMPKEEWIAQRQALSLENLFGEAGITFPEGASLTYEPAHSAMTIENTDWNFELLESLLTGVALDISRDRALGILTH